MRDKTLGVGRGGPPRVNWATPMEKSANLCRQMTFMPLYGARREEAAESAVSRVQERLLFTVKGGCFHNTPPDRTEPPAPAALRRRRLAPVY